MSKVVIGITFILAASALVIALNNKPNVTATTQEPVYQQVLAKKILRCGYTNFAPMVIMDPNTKQMSGIMYDIMNEAGKRLGIKIDWSQEVGWGDIVTNFGAKRMDAFCTGLWPGANRATNTLFTNGIFWDPVALFVRANDDRFTDNPSLLNDPSYTLAYAEGDATESITKVLFPDAKVLPLAQVNSMGDLFAQVTTKKADGAMGTRLAGVLFMEQNPGLVKEIVPSDRPLRVYPITIGLPEGEYGMKKMLDDGTVERIATKYMKGREGMLYRLETEYEPL